VEAKEDGSEVPLVVLLLAGNPATAVALLQLLNTVDATALRRLHPVVGTAVETLPWCDRATGVADVVRWRAAFPAAIGTRLVRLDPAVTAATLAGLTYLDVSECEMNVTDEVIRRLPPTLRTLDVHGCSNVFDAVSFAHIPALETLKCSFTSIGNNAIATLPPTLAMLQAACCRVSTGADFRHMITLRTLKCGQLPKIDVCSSNLPSSLEDLTILTVRLNPHVAPFAHLALRALLLCWCQVPHTALASLPSTIVQLLLANCTGLATSSFSKPPPPKLDVFYCQNSDLGDAAVATLPPSLSRLTVAGRASRLTPAATFPQHMPALQKVNLSDTAIGNATIASLPPQLTTLIIDNCTNVTSTARQDRLINLKE